MRVARSFAPGDVRIEEAPEPELGPGEVVCDVLACGVCGSDVTDWYIAPRLPAVLGHELVGTVRAVGAGVDAPEVGARVVIHHHAPCGECRRCRRGHDGLDPITATFIEPLACVLRSQDRAGLRAGDSLLVVGAGVNGLLQIAAAHAHGVDVVWVREPRRERLERAEAWGAEHHGNELVDVAIACTPKPDAIAAAAAAVAPGGTLCFYAPPSPTAPPELDATTLYLREITVTASYSAGPADMRAALELIAGGRIDPRSLVSHRLPLEQTGRALDLQRTAGGLKVVVEP